MAEPLQKTTPSAAPSRGATPAPKTPAPSAAATLTRGAETYTEGAAAMAPEADEAPMTPDPNAAPEPGVLERRGGLRPRLTALERTLADRVNAHATWLSLNWTSYLGSVGGNPAVALDEQTFRSLAQVPEVPSVGGAALDAIGSTLAATPAAVVGSVASKQVGAAAARGATTAVGTLAAGALGSAVGVLVSLVWSIIDQVLAARAADKTRHAQSKAQAEQTGEKVGLFAGQAASAIGDQRTLLDRAGECLESARVHATLDLMERWIDGELAALGAPIDTNDKSLYHALMSAWVLQHSAAPGEANATTSPAAYEDATRPRPVSDGVKDGEPILFVHQLKLGLLESGFMDPTVVAGLEARARQRTQHGNAVHVASAFDGTTLRLARVSDPAAFARQASASGGVLGVDATRAPDFAGAARRGNVRAVAHLQVEAVDGAPVLARLTIDAECVGRDRAAWDEGVAMDGAPGGFDAVEIVWAP